MQYDLRRYGIQLDTFPVTTEGKVRNDILKKWVEKQRQVQNSAARYTKYKDNEFMMISSSDGSGRDGGSSGTGSEDGRNSSSASDDDGRNSSSASDDGKQDDSSSDNANYSGSEEASEERFMVTSSEEDRSHRNSRSTGRGRTSRSSRSPSSEDGSNNTDSGQDSGSEERSSTTSSTTTSTNKNSNQNSQRFTNMLITSSSETGSAGRSAPSEADYGSSATTGQDGGSSGQDTEEERFMPTSSEDGSGNEGGSNTPSEDGMDETGMDTKAWLEEDFSAFDQTMKPSSTSPSNTRLANRPDGTPSANTNTIQQEHTKPESHPPSAKRGKPNNDEQGVTPTQKDVLLGRGKRNQDHPGNIAFRELVERCFDEYDMACRTKKRQLASELATSFRVSGGRFLKLSDQGRWIESDSAEEAKTVMQLFRSIRKFR